MLGRESAPRGSVGGVRAEGLVKRFGDFTALAGVDFEVAEATVPVTLKLPPTTVHALRAYARSSGLTIGAIVTRALDAFLGALRRHG